MPSGVVRSKYKGKYAAGKLPVVMNINELQNGLGLDRSQVICKGAAQVKLLNIQIGKLAQVTAGLWVTAQRSVSDWLSVEFLSYWRRYA